MQICSGNESSGRADGEGPQVLGVKVDRRRDKKLQVRWEIYGILRILAVIEPAGNVASPDATSCNFSRCELLQSEDITRGEWISWGLAFLCKCNNSNTTDFFGHIKPLSGIEKRKIQFALDGMTSDTTKFYHVLRLHRSECCPTPHGYHR